MVGVLTVSFLDEDIQSLENPKGQEKSLNLAGNDNRFLRCSEAINVYDSLR